QLLDRAAITVNKNTIPGDPQSPFVTSGIRLGTPAVTTRGFGVEEMERVAELIDTVLTKRDEGTVEKVKREVRELVEEFPLYAKGLPPLVAAVPMVSFCDIPLSQTHYHLDVYGCYGLGLTKRWGLRKGISPVMYTYPGAESTAPVFRAAIRLRRFQKANPGPSI